MKTQYKLFVLPVSIENIKIANKERFSRITSDYIMIYSEKDKPKEAVEITEKHITRLTEQERKWLFVNNEILITEETKHMASEIMSSMDEKLTELEKLLTIEQQSFAEEDAVNGTKS